MHDSKDTVSAVKIRQGDEEAFRDVYDLYHIQMFYIAKKYVKENSLAEDAVQDVFVKLWEKRNTLDENKSLKGFLFTMLKNHVLNVLRDMKKETIPISKVGESTLPCPGCTDDQIIYKDFQNILKKGLSELSNRKREVFEMKTMEGYSNPEIAKILEINIRTVKTHYYNSSKFMKLYLKNHVDILIIVFIFLSKHI
jgi:RNA polymerase sigma-70 factor (family 1)